MQDWIKNVPLLKGGYGNDLLKEVDALRETKTIYPPQGQEFRAMELVPFNEVKVVILGQDPYHGPGQAHGLSFSVPEGVKQPPSLRNIFKEIDATVYDTLAPHHSTDLTRWAKQGVLLLNSVLTVEEKKPGSHAKLGWEKLTDDIIQALSDRRDGIIFMLWGNFAKTKAPLIDPDKHHIFEAAHPSPFSAHKGFFGCDHFRKANELLTNPIDW